MMSRMGHQRPGASHPVIATLVAILVGALVTGCQAEPPSDDPTQEPGSAALRVRTVSGAERLDEQARTEIEGAVGDVLSGYVVEAFLGDFPREGFVRSFESFTSGAARTAARHIEQLTAARVQDATAVRATRLDARLSVLAEDQRVHGATAAVRFAFEATMADGTTRPLSLEGRFLLEDDGDEWSVFGYDVALDDGAPVSSEPAP